MKPQKAKKLKYVQLTETQKRFAPYSFSKMMVHNQCPQKFKFKMIDQIPFVFVPNEALTKGRQVHHLLENIATLDESTRQLLGNIMLKGESAYTKDALDKCQASYNIVLDYQKGTVEKQQNYLSDVTGQHEVEIAFDDHFQKVGYWDKNCFYRGKVDLHTTQSNSEISLIDWKTGKYREIHWQDFNQLVFYALYYFYSNPEIQKINISYVYVEHDIENRMTLERQYLMNYLKDFLTIIKDLENDVEYAPYVAPLCGYCDLLGVL